MKSIEVISDWLEIRRKIEGGKTVGFVPTMGSLHQGHGFLVDQARQENDIVVVSIFINPTQFNEPSDYKNYPRNIEKDKAYATELGVDYLLVPTEKDMYSEGATFSIEPHLAIAKTFEGALRPGHFAGMLTVVMKLLQLVQPTRAYFGEKDYQQLVLIKKMVKYFFMPVDIVGCQIVREPSGLPLSSRNSNLTVDQKLLAQQAFQLIRQADPDSLQCTQDKLKQLGIAVDYLDVCDNRFFSAIHIGETRLIDNYNLEDDLC